MKKARKNSTSVPLDPETLAALDEGLKSGRDYSWKELERYILAKRKSWKEIPEDLSA